MTSNPVFISGKFSHVASYRHLVLAENQTSNSYPDRGCRLSAMRASFWLETAVVYVKPMADGMSLFMAILSVYVSTQVYYIDVYPPSEKKEDIVLFTKLSGLERICPFFLPLSTFFFYHPPPHTQILSFPCNIPKSNPTHLRKKVLIPLSVNRWSGIFRVNCLAMLPQK